MAAATAREVAPQPAVTRLAWGLCLLAVLLAVGTWPLRGPELVTPEGEEPDLVTAVFGVTLMTTLALGAISVVALVLRFRRAGAV